MVIHALAEGLDGLTEPDVIEGLLPHVSHRPVVQPAAHHVSVGQQVEQIPQLPAREPVLLPDHLLAVGGLGDDQGALPQGKSTYTLLGLTKAVY